MVEIALVFDAGTFSVMSRVFCVFRWSLRHLSLWNNFQYAERFVRILTCIKDDYFIYFDILTGLGALNAPVSLVDFPIRSF
jgi:hypothetical protein